MRRACRVVGLDNCFHELNETTMIPCKLFSWRELPIALPICILNYIRMQMKTFICIKGYCDRDCQKGNTFYFDW